MSRLKPRYRAKSRRIALPMLMGIMSEIAWHSGMNRPPRDSHSSFRLFKMGSWYTVFRILHDSQTHAAAELKRLPDSHKSLTAAEPYPVEFHSTLKNGEHEDVSEIG